MIAQVVYGSPAAVAGLQAADRVDAVNGKSFANLAEFNRLLDESSETLTLRSERRGQIRDVSLQLLK